MIKALIVDDEPLALEVLETYIEQLPKITLIGKCNNAIEAGEILDKEEVDVIFLDIQMPQLSGIDFVKSMTKKPLIVFTTAYPNYAVEGFELDAVDYLLKPISLDRFMKCVNKIAEKLNIDTKSDSFGESDEDYMFVKADKKLIKVNYDELIYIEGLKDYVQIKHDGGRIITLQTMKSLEERLPTKYFKRIHRSFIVNIQKIEAILGNAVEIIEKGQVKHLPIGKNYRDELLELINERKL
jgi:DNA-binding LytR/AlgR family response regulator